MLVEHDGQKLRPSWPKIVSASHTAYKEGAYNRFILEAPMTLDADLITRLYQHFNARDMEALLAAMHPDVTWANGMEGGYVHGREGVREYWTRQWAMIDPHVEPTSISTSADGKVVVEVHATIRDLAGAVLLDHSVGHIFTVENGLIARFDIRGA